MKTLMDLAIFASIAAAVVTLTTPPPKHQHFVYVITLDNQVEWMMFV